MAFLIIRTVNIFTIFSKLSSEAHLASEASKVLLELRNDKIQDMIQPLVAGLCQMAGQCMLDKGSMHVRWQVNACQMADQCMLDKGSMHVRWQVNACWIGGRCMLDRGSMHVG